MFIYHWKITTILKTNFENGVCNVLAFFFFLIRGVEQLLISF